MHMISYKSMRSTSICVYPGNRGHVCTMSGGHSSTQRGKQSGKKSINRNDTYRHALSVLLVLVSLSLQMCDVILNDLVPVGAGTDTQSTHQLLRNAAPQVLEVDRQPVPSLFTYVHTKYMYRSERKGMIYAT